MSPRLVIEAKSLKPGSAQHQLCNKCCPEYYNFNKCFFMQITITPDFYLSMFHSLCIFGYLDCTTLGGNGKQVKWIFHFSKYLEPPPLLRTFFKFCVQVERYLTKRPRKWGREACAPRVPFSVLFWAEFRQIST